MLVQYQAYTINDMLLRQWRTCLHKKIPYRANLAGEGRNRECRKRLNTLSGLVARFGSPVGYSGSKGQSNLGLGGN